MPLTLMTVDDSRTIRRIVAGHARQLDPRAEVIEAADGQECLAQVELRHPDIIVLDVNMPVMNGEECLMRLKANPATRAIPVVLLTTESEKNLVMRMLRLGIAQYIIKPFQREEFMEKVGAVWAKLQAAGTGLAVPEGDYLLVLEDRENVAETIRAAAEGLYATWVVATTEAAYECFLTKAPVAVIANLRLQTGDVFELFSRMRRVPERQQVRYWAMSLRTAGDLISRARATRYLGLLLKPFTVQELHARLEEWQATQIRREVRGTAVILHAAATAFPAQLDALLSAIDTAAEEGFAGVLLDLQEVAPDTLRGEEAWNELAEHAAALGLRVACVSSDPALGEWLGTRTETHDLHLAADLDGGLAALAA